MRPHQSHSIKILRILSVYFFFELFTRSKGGYFLRRYFDLFAWFLRVVRFASVAASAFEGAETNKGYAISASNFFCYNIGKGRQNSSTAFFVVVVRAAISAASSALFTESPPVPILGLRASNQLHVEGKNTAPITHRQDRRA